RRGVRRAGAHVARAGGAAVAIVAADRRAEEPVGGGEDVDGDAEAREGPGETLTIDAAHGDQAVDGADGGGGLVDRLAGRRALAGELVAIAVAGRGDEEGA